MKENIQNIGENPVEQKINKNQIELVVNRGETKEFKDLSFKSIALDGYVQGPAIDNVNQKYSFDHHDGCIRTLTSATCKQVSDAILLGLNPEGHTVLVNDVDGDTALSVWLLQHPNKADNQLVRRLVDVVGSIDSFGQSYPVIDQDLANAFYQGAMKPEKDLRMARKYGEANLSELLNTCVDNIEALVNGTLEWEARPVKERSFEITHEGTDWVMAQSNDFIFDMLYKQGFNKAIAYQKLTDGSYAYTVGKKSDFVNFPVKEILTKLNEIEPGWGGSSTVGGSPRNPDGSRSRLEPSQVFEITENVVANK